MVKFLGYIHRNAEKTFKKVLRKFQGSVNEFLLDYKEIVLEVSKKNQESVNDVLWNDQRDVKEVIKNHQAFLIDSCKSWFESP